MATWIYAGCALTSLLCAFLLLRAWRRSRMQVLWWSGLCFCGLTLGNIVLMLDKLVFLEVDLTVCRLVLTLGSMLVLIYGLTKEDKR